MRTKLLKPSCARVLGISVLATSMLGGAAAAQPQSPKQIRWDLPGAYSSATFHTQLLRQFAQNVQTLSNGKLGIAVHENASLFKATEIKRAVQGGQVQIGEIVISNFANEDPLFGVDGLPFLTSSYDTAWRLYQAQKPVLQNQLERQGLMLLYTVPWPPQGIYTNRDLHTVADMRGLKMRAYNPATARIAELVGAQAVTIQAAELSQAMATGATDAFITSSATGYDTKVYEHLKKFYATNVLMPKNAVIVNTRAFNALDADIRQAVLQASAQIETRGWQLSQERRDGYLAELAKHGMTIITPSPELMAGLNQVGAIMLDEWLAQTGQAGRALIAAYRNGDTSGQ